MGDQAHVLGRFLRAAGRSAQRGFPGGANTQEPSFAFRWASDFKLPVVPNDAQVVETAKALALHDDLLANAPEGVRHDTDICPICVDKATETANPPSRIPPASSGGPDVSEHQQPSPTNTEGGTPNPMSDNASISQETHKALLTQAVADATSALDKALEQKTTEVADLAAKNEKLEADNASLKADNDRINGELDKAQVDLKTAQDEVASLKSDIAKREEDEQKAEIASKRAEKVKNLKLFPDEYVAEKASSWAELTDEAFAERVEEWSKLHKPAESNGEQDAASAMSGTTEKLTTETTGEAGTETAGETTKKPSARRAVLGLS